MKIPYHRKYFRDLTAILSKEGMESHLNDEQHSSARAFEVLAEQSLMRVVDYIRYVENIGEFSKQVPDGTLGNLQPLWLWFAKVFLPSKVYFFFQKFNPPFIREVGCFVVI